MDLTNEQQIILQSFLKWNDIKINAFAWCGKSTTLKILAKAIPNKKILLLVFNTAVASELRKKLPNNTIVSTIHSFALKYVRSVFWKRRYKSNYKYDFLTRFHLDTTTAHLLDVIFEAFFNSHLKDINTLFVINFLKKNDKYFEVFKKIWIKIADIIKYIVLLKIEIEKWNIWLTHSFYLKYFQLNIEKFLPEIDFDVVMLDEWQDTNDVSLDIFNKIDWQKVIVWDSHQSIYWRRWANNALSKVDFQKFYLSKTFRLPEKIAYKANHILKNYKLEWQKMISFFKDWWKSNWKTCIITRWNVEIVKYIYTLEKWETVLFERKIDEIFHLPLEFNKIKMYYIIWSRKYLRKVNPYFSSIAQRFNTWNNFCNYIENELKDYILISTCKLVNRFNVLDIYIKAKHLPKTGNLYIATAHSIKWREYEKTIILNDFFDLFEEMKKYTKKHKISATKFIDLFFNHTENFHVRPFVEEINTIYVAITRCIKTTEIQSQFISKLLETNKEQFIDLIKKSKIF